MESSSIELYIPQKSKKRVFMGSSSTSMEAKVIEKPPKLKAKAVESKKVIYHEIIDLDMDDEDCNDVVFVEGKVGSNKKMKGISSSATRLEPRDMVHSMKKAKSNKGKEVIPIMSSKPSSFTPGSDNFIDLDGVSDSFTPDLYAGDYLFEDDYLTLQSYLDTMDLPCGIEVQIPWLPDTPKMENQSVTSHTQFNPIGSGKNSAVPRKSSDGLPKSKEVPSGQKIQHTKLPNNDMNVDGTGSYFSNTSTGVERPISKQQNSNLIMKNHKETKDSLVGSSSSSMARHHNEDVLKRYEGFKKFDTALDHSDHYFSSRHSGVKEASCEHADKSQPLIDLKGGFDRVPSFNNLHPPMNRPSKVWAKKIQDEWRILEKDLPDTIFVRVYESRMDLLRAVIIGAEGTPYHDGLFFFDIYFPSIYPAQPPHVHYHSGGLRINPNLYYCGKVCLSLLNTWYGGPEEMWTPGVSTVLQVLVSIQGLILNANPYFNEPGNARGNGSAYFEEASLDYNEETLILSLKTMVYTMKNPPKNFKDLVIGHFCHQVRNILMACEAYTQGVQVGCHVNGGKHKDGKSCSAKFKNNVASYVEVLIHAFKKIGAKEAEEFIGLTGKISGSVPKRSR
ncbi:hypothetical protein OSB04_007447 [Centaurea solstitialis]|uniref:E2 ubiquitin-conjugating enzyme n=1 Tax=Centaurea solstitialis TaxID=347529 RepID=A0AA38U345_9ASTR|nr:hypothetical protein OSB04_007447 [Centaurea solstitialis]